MVEDLPSPPTSLPEHGFGRTFFNFFVRVPTLIVFRAILVRHSFILIGVATLNRLFLKKKMFYYTYEAAPCKTYFFLYDTFGAIDEPKAPGWRKIRHYGSPHTHKRAKTRH